MSDPDFFVCGFKNYIVTSVLKGSLTEIKISNPHVEDDCSTIDSCLTRIIDSSIERVITLTITASTLT